MLNFRKASYLVGLLIFIILPLSSQAADSLVVDEGVDISANLESNYEPSGIVWHERLQSLFTVWDNGYLSQIDNQGNILHSTVYVGGDLEGITIVDDQSNYIYLLREYPQQIIEFDLSTWTRTGKIWSLEGMSGNSSQGAEALTYNQDNNLFYVGSQYDGDIYIYDIDLNFSAEVDYLDILETGISSDCSGLYYSEETNLTYAIFDSSNIVYVYSPDDQFLVEYDLPGSAQEGITIYDNTLYIAQDSGAIMKYEQKINKKDIVIVETSSSGIPYIFKTLDNDYGLTMISLDELKSQGVPEKAEVLIMPGSADYLNYVSYSTISLDQDIVNNLKDFTDQGGGFVGICGGSIVGASVLETTYAGSDLSIEMANLAPVTAVAYLEWYEQYAGSESDMGLLNFSDHVLAGEYASGTHKVDYYGGPYFKDYNEVEVVAEYTQDFLDNKAAIVAKNKIVLSAVHPEYKTDTRFLLQNMVSYALGEIEQPIPDPEPVDSDGDGYSEEEDCDDENYLVHEEIIYYYDYDQDELGNLYSFSAVCSLDIPENHVDNADDLNDYDHDNDSVNTDSDCNDSDVNIWDLQKYYADTDNDGLGDPENYLEICSLEIPEGYVDNYSDEAGEPVIEEPEPEEELTVEVNGKYIYINGEETRIFKYKPIKTRYNISDNEDQIKVIGLFKKRATIVTLELDSDYNIISKDRHIIRYRQVVKKGKEKIKALKAKFF